MERSLILLDDSEFTYQQTNATWGEVFESTFLGAGEAAEDETNVFVFYEVSKENKHLGKIWQLEDLTWVATPTPGDGIQKKVDSQTCLTMGRQRPSVKGFAHELYAAEYLEQIALRDGLLAGQLNI